MIRCVIDQPVAGKNKPFGAPAVSAERIDVTFVISAPVFFRKGSFIVSEPVSSDALSGCVGLQRTAFPAQITGFFL